MRGNVLHIIHVIALTQPYASRLSDEYMKKILLFIAFIIPLTASAQTKRTIATKKVTTTQQKKVMPTFSMPTFHFNPDATFTTSTENEYIVYEAVGYKQNELYDAMLLGISKLFKNPDKVLTKVENQLITVNAISDYCVHYSKYVYAFSYTIKFQFKDGKIRVDTPIVNAFIPTSGEHKDNVAGWIRTQKNYNEVKPGFEKGMNSEIYTFLTKSFSKEDTDW